MTDSSIRQAIPAYTFGIAQTFDDLDTGWRPFPGHYLLYAASGAFRLDVARARWLLPPQRAAWIAAGVPIRLRTHGLVQCNSVLFEHTAIPTPTASCTVFGMSSLAREMLHYSMRWGTDRSPADPSADRFFRVLADVCMDLAARPELLWLPRPESPELERAVAYTLGALAGPLQLAEVAQVAGVSERTLLRRFTAETHMTWRQFVGRARMIRAIELLSQRDLPVIEVAYATGFESVSAFSTAFRRFTGETPSDYRRRMDG